MQFVSGTATSGDVLQRAGIERTGVLVACTGLDEVNIVTCMLARQLGSARTICFVSREDFVQGTDAAGSSAAAGSLPV